MSLEWTRVRLAQWGRWCRGGRRTGYPTASAFVWAGHGDRAKYDGNDMPWEIAEIENAVMLLSHHCRKPLLWYYTRTGPIWWKALQCEVPKTTFLRRVKMGEDAVDRRLTIADQKGYNPVHRGDAVTAPLIRSA